MPIERPNKPGVPQETVDAVLAFVRSDDNSRVAPDRTAKVKDDLGLWQEVERRWTADSILSLWSKFIEKYPEHHVSLSKFYDLIP